MIKTKTKTPKKEKWEEIGFCGVDAGMLMIGDPCYFLTGERSEAHQKYKGDWSAALDDFYAQGGENFTESQLHYVRGHAGLGVVIHVDGDGSYPVMARRNQNGNIVELRIRTGFADDQKKGKA